MATCPSGHRVPDEQRFCGDCGQPVVAPAEAMPGPGVAEGEAAAHTGRRLGRHRWWWLIGAAIVLLLVVFVRWIGGNDAAMLTGEFALVDSEGFTGSTGSCRGAGGYSDFGPGMDVTIRNGDGAIVATASTEALQSDAEEVLSELLYGDDACVVVWEAEVPDDEAFYEIEIGRRGSLSYSHAELTENDWHVTTSLGD